MSLKIFPLREILRDPPSDPQGKPYCSCSKKEKCPTVGKHPAVRWRTLTYWSEIEPSDNGIHGSPGPGGGFGIPTGRRNGIFVIEGDVKPGKGPNGSDIDGVSALLAMGPLPETRVVRTPSGSAHFYFQYPSDEVFAAYGCKDIRNSGGALGPGIDVRGEGGMVVGEGSPHKRGGVYEVVVDVAPAPLPEWLLLKLVAIEQGKGVSVYEAENIPHVLEDLEEGEHLTRAIEKARKYLEEVPPCIEDGQSSARLGRYAAALRAKQIPYEQCLDLLENVFNPRCEPPWPLEDLERILHSVEEGPIINKVARDIEQAERVFANLSSRVTPENVHPQTTNPEHQYTYEAGMRSMVERKKYDYGSILSDLFDHKDWAGVLSYDTFHARVKATNPPMRLDAEKDSGLSDTDIDLIRGWFEYNGKGAQKEDIRCAVEVVAKRNSFNPVQDYLKSLRWDRMWRLDRVLPNYFMTADGPYELAIGRKWFISLVARAMEPGCQSDCTLILEGSQGIGKTSAFRALMHDPTWYAESSAGVDSKDFFENLRGVWLMGFDELDSLTRRSLTRVKTVLTSVRDKYRKSYGHYSDSHPRCCGFCGSTNEVQYFNDYTGSRRLWPVRVLRPIDVPHIVEDRDQIWAEALVRWQAGEPWHVDSPELLKLCEAEQEQRLEIDAWEDPIVEWLADPTKVSRIPLNGTTPDGIFKPGGIRPYDASKGITTGAVLEKAIGKLKGQWNSNDAQRVGRILRRLGLERSQIRSNGISEWRYNLPEIVETDNERPKIISEARKHSEN